MAEFGLIGYPIAHSKSPALFSAAYSGKCHSYHLIEEKDLDQAMKLFLNGSYSGVNVTSPFKDKVFEYVSRPDRISSILGSANLLLKDSDFKSNGILYSYNTDYYGVKNSVDSHLKDFDIESVAVIGAGGAGKAAALAMRDCGYRVILVNRSRERAEPFANSIGAEYSPLDSAAEAVAQAQLVIYSLSFMVEELKGADFSQKVIFEANYADPQLAPEKGIESKRYLGGKYWLYHQAVPAFEIFTKEKPNELNMRDIIGL